MKKKSLFLSALGTLLTLSMAQAAPTPTGTITIVDQFQPQTVTAGGNSSYRMEIGSTQGQQLTGVGFTVDLSPAYSSIQSFTSTCGGTVTWVGTVATFSGGTMNAAPSASNPTLCDVTITGIATLTSGTKNIAVGMGNIVTDQGLTNSNGTASTLTITPLKPLHIDQNYSSQVNGNISSLTNYGVTLASKNYISYQISNPNNQTIDQITSSITIPANSYLIGSPIFRPDLSKCSSSDDISALQNSTTTYINGKEISSGIQLSGNSTCTIIIEANYNDFPDSLPTDINGEPLSGNLSSSSGISENIQMAISSSRDSILSASYTRGATSPEGISIAKTFNNLSTYSTNYDNDSTIELGIIVQNNTLYDTKYSLTDPLPSSLVPVNSIIDVKSNTLTNGSGNKNSGYYKNGIRIYPVPYGNCTIDGASYDSATNKIILNNTTIPAFTTCTYTIKINKPTLTSGTIANTIPTSSISEQNAITTLSENRSLPANIIGARAIINTDPGIVWRKGGFNSSYKQSSSYSIVIQNKKSSNQDFSFSDSWANNLLIDATQFQNRINQINASSSVGCQNLVAILDSNNKGFSITGTVKNNTYCQVDIPIDINTVLLGTYNNTTSNLTLSDGTTYTPVSAVGIVSMDKDLSAAQIVIPLNSPSTLSFQLINSAAVPIVKTETANLPSGLNIDLSKPFYKKCQNGTSTILPLSAININNNIVSIAVDMPANTTCIISYTATVAVPGLVQVSGTSNYDGYSIYQGTTHTNPLDGSGYLFNYTTTSTNTYTVNKIFNPQTISAGSDTNLTFSILSSGSTYDSLSDSYAQIIDNLPDGMLVSPANYAPNQSDGSYISELQVPSNYIDGNLPCLEVNSARTQIISRCRQTSYAGSLYSTIKIRITKYGDLINTIQPNDVQPFYGDVIAPASASAKATQGVPIIKSFNPKLIQSGQQSQFSVTVYNAATELSGINTINFTDTLPNYLTAETTPTVTGTCTGATVGYNTASKLLSYSNIQLAPNTNCTVTIPVTGTSTSTSNVTTTNTIPANNVVSSLGSSNPQSTSDTITITPGAAQPGIIKEQGICTDSTCSNVTYSKNPITVKGCQYVSYRLTYNNTGYSPAFTPVARDPWPDGMIFKGATSPVNSNYNTLFQVDNNGWTSSAPTGITSGQTLKVGLDSDKNGNITQADKLAPNQTVQVFLTGQIEGNNCQ